MTTVASDSSSGPVVREATRADLLEVVRIERASFPQPWPFGVFEQFLGRPGFLVAESHEGPCPSGGAVEPCVVGYVVADLVRDTDRPMGHVKDLAVAEERRGEGIGRDLLGRALSVVEAQDVSATKLEVRETNAVATSLYESFGFDHHHTREDYYENGEDALVLMRDPER